MTAPRFRSTAAFSRRHRQHLPLVDRATFVIFSLHGHRFAVPVELVERVLRGGPTDGDAKLSVDHGGRRVPVLDLRGALGLAHTTSHADGRDALERTLVFTVHGAWVACIVDAVYEVATIDASTVRPFTPEDGDATWTDAARARFVRHERDVLVLDIVRVARAVYEAAQRAARDAGASPAALHS